MYRFFLACAFLLLAPPSSAFGQNAEESALLRGFVRAEADGRSLPGANVILRDAGGGIEEAAATDEDGFYQFARLDPGRYVLRVSFVGYQSYQDTLQLAAGERRTISVSLRTVPRELEGVTVEGRRPVEESEVGVRRIRTADIETIPTPGPGSDLSSYLRSLPGVTTLGDRGGRLYVRGGTPAQNLVLVDGSPVYKPFHIIGLYSAFPSDLVSSSEFYAGGFGAEYTGRISSVLDIQIRSGNTKKYQGSVGLGPFMGSAHVEGPLKRDSRSFLLHARHSFIEHSGPALLSQDAPYKFYDVMAKVHTQSESSQCSFTGMRTYDRGRIDPNRDASFRWDNTTIGGQCLVFGGESAQTLNVSFGTSHFNNTVRSTNGTVRTAGTWKAHTKWTLTQPIPWNGTIRWGGNVQADKYDFSFDENFLGVTSEDQFFLRASTHVGADWEWNDRIEVEPSLGVLSHFEWEGVSIDPRLRFSYRPGGSERTKLSTAGGIYHQMATGVTDERDAGSTFQVWMPTPFSNRPQHARHALLGWEQLVGSTLRLSVEGWYKQLRDLPVPRWTPLVRFNTNLVRADGTAYGTDLSLEYNWGPLRLNVNYGYGKTTYRASEDQLGAWVNEPIVEYSPPHDLRHKLGVTTRLEAEDWFTANVRWQYSSGLPFTQVYGYDTMLEVRGLRDSPYNVAGVPRALYDRPYGARLPAYHRLDVSLQRAFALTSTVDLSAEAGAINAYDRANIFYIDIFTLDRVNQLSLLPYLSLEARFN